MTAAFFRASLGQQFRCVYVHDQLDDAAAIQALARAGLDVSDAMRTAALRVPASIVTLRGRGYRLVTEVGQTGEA